MHRLTRADQIWNRACQGGGMAPRAGDKALAALLVFHGVSMNGGVLHAIGCLNPIELSAAESGYRYFGFDRVADLVREARRMIEAGSNLESHEVRLEKEYGVQIPDDSTLVERFENFLNAKPFEFSPL